MAAAAALLALSCGGGKTEAERPGGPGESTSDLDTGGEDAEGDAGPGEEGTPDAGGPPPAVTFVLKNSHDQELAFNMDYGWQPVLSAYSGKPPKAVPILMFASFCTASCDAAEEERCPVCPQPEKAKDILAAQKMEKVAAGAELEVPWDGQIFIYEKGQGTRDGRKKRCECSRTEPASPGTYTVKACGLRLTTTADKRSQLQCIESEMIVGEGGEPQRIEFDFGAPAAAKKKKKR